METSKDDATAGERAGLDASSGKENGGAGENGGLLNTGSVAPTSGPKYPMTEAMREELNRRFRYHSPKDDQPTRYQHLRDQALNLAELIVLSTPPGREQSLALTKLEEAVMHANSAIARGE